MANISTVIGEFNKQESRFNTRIGGLKEYLNSEGCHRLLTRQILEHFRQSMKRDSVFDNENIFKRLPFHIRTSMKVFANKSTFNGIPFFKYIHSDSVKIYLLNILSPRFVETGTTLVKEGDQATEIIFLTGGKGIISLLSHAQKVSERSTTTPTNTKISKGTSVLRFLNRRSISIINKSFHNRRLSQQKVEIPDDLLTCSERVKKIEARRRWELIRTNKSKIRSMEKDAVDFSAITSMDKPIMRDILIFEDVSIIPADENKRHPLKMFSAISTRGGLTNKEVKPKPHTKAHHVRVKELGEFIPGDIFGHHAMRLGLSHACTVVATEPCWFYTMTKVDILTLIKDRPDVAFQFQTALGKAVFDVDLKVGLRHRKQESLDFLHKINQKYSARHQTTGATPLFPELIKKITKASPEEKGKLRSEFYALLKQDRRSKSIFKHFYRLQDGIQTLVKNINFKSIKKKILKPPSKLFLRKKSNAKYKNLTDSVLSIPPYNPTATVQEKRIRLDKLQETYGRFLDEYGLYNEEEFSKFCEPFNGGKKTNEVRGRSRTIVSIKTKPLITPKKKSSFFDLQRKVVHPLAIVEATFLLPSTRIVRKTVNMRDVARQAYMKKHSSYNDLFDLSCLYKQEEKLIHPSRAVRRHSFSHSSFG